MNLLVSVHYSDNGSKRHCGAARLQDRRQARRQCSACLCVVGKATQSAKEVQGSPTSQCERFKSGIVQIGAHQALREKAYTGHHTEIKAMCTPV